MAYIIKNTSGLINTRVTDTGRFKMAQGNFNIAYFQIGDSEICYNCTTASTTYNIVNNNILEPCFNSQNSVGVPSSNKQNIKYPYYTDDFGGNTYAIPFNNAKPEGVFNAAAQRGFFSGTTGSMDKSLSSAYTKNANFTVDIGSNPISPSNRILISSGVTCGTFTGSPSVGDFLTVFLDLGGSCLNNTSQYPTLTFRITGATPSGSDYIIGLDRDFPDYSSASIPGVGRIFIYPSGMTQLYDTYTPTPHWYDNVIDFESVCETDAFNVLIWNMNIPWTETPAGIDTTTYVDFTQFGSVSYIGTKEYLGYNTSSGQTIYPTGTPTSYYYNSYDEIVTMTPEEQKSIAIVHYTNNTIDLFYGEKFALEPYDPSNPTNTMGQASNFKISLPWLQWHKSPTYVSSGETFYVEPPNYIGTGILTPYYIQSTKNDDMNNPGIRYYNLYDNHANVDGLPNKVGKVFPDQKIVVFDDEEIIAAMSYKSNRSWTLPAPKVSLITPNACSGSTSGGNGVLSSDTQYMYITYRFDNTTYNYDSLHCNYYQKISGPATGCSITAQDVTFAFGNEFPYMSTSNTTTSGFSATDFKVICQIVSGNTRPNSYMWKEIDFTSSLTTTNGFINPSSLTGQTFTITESDYSAAPTYDLSNYITLTQLNTTGSTLNFGDEYYFYGTVETDIQATIYEMRYLCNLNSAQFQYSSNPTWTSGNTSYVTEIGLFDTDKDLLVISKLQSPVQRMGVQQFLVKFDF
jgi:hypothetical protein